MKNFYLLLFFAIHAQTIFAQTDFFFVKLQPESIEDTISSNQLGIPLGSWAGEINTRIKGELVYAPEDSIGIRLLCDTPSVDFTDKIVLIDRGECLFSWKAFQAQQMGAIGVIIRNVEDTVVNMANSPSGMEVDIPVIMIPYEVGVDLEEALLNEETVLVGFFPDLILKTITFHQNISINIYPNPMKDFSIIELNGRKIENGEIQLYDFMGRLVKKQTFSQNKFMLKRNNLPNGNYFFKISLKSSIIVATGLLQIIE